MSLIKPVVDQQTIIMRNVARWQQEQRRKVEKRERLADEALRLGVTPQQLVSKKREARLGREGRATIQSILSSKLTSRVDTNLVILPRKLEGK